MNFHILDKIKSKRRRKKFYRKAETAAKVIFDVFQSESYPDPLALNYVQYNHTDTPMLPTWLRKLPLIDVAQSWNLSVGCFPGGRSIRRGYYSFDLSIGLSVYNLATWAHELIHAADDRKGTLTKKGGQHPDNEIVAALGATILLELLDESVESDIGGCWQTVWKYAPHKLTLVTDCQQFLKRTCDCVALILETAERI